MNKNELIREIIEKYNFKNKKEREPDSCPCYNGTRCHTLNEKELICLFCLCPEYDLKNIEGRCKINSPYGKWFDHKKYPTGRIWDCSDCSIPHSKKYVQKFLKKLSISELEKFLM